MHGAFVLPLSVAMLQRRSYDALMTLPCRFTSASLRVSRYRASGCYKKSLHGARVKPQICHILNDLTPCFQISARTPLRAVAMQKIQQKQRQEGLWAVCVLKLARESARQSLLAPFGADRGKSGLHRVG